MKIILASKSPQRRKILEENGIEFEVDASNVDEDEVKLKADDVKGLVIELSY